MFKKYFDIFIAAGGTFGHIRPAITLTQALEEQGYSVLFFCAKKDKKFPLIQQREKDKLKYLTLNGLPQSKKSLFLWFKFFILLLFNIFLLGFSFLYTRPKIVVACGGFVSFPVLFWAKIYKIPYIILEQNSLPGLVSRLFFKTAKRIFFAMDPIKQEYKNFKQAYVVGNPLKVKYYLKSQALDYFHLNPNSKVNKVIGCIGGSLGAKALIEWSIKQQEYLVNKDLILLCVTGQSLYTQVKDILLENIIFVPFVDDMFYFYSLCDIIISRSGASTISELFQYKKPVIFVPYPFATENHQYFNAQFALEYLQGCIVEQTKLDDYSIIDLIQKANMDKSIKKDPAILSDALDTVVNYLKEYL